MTAYTLSLGLVIVVFSIWISICDIKSMAISNFLFLACNLCAVTVQFVFNFEYVWIKLLSALIFGAVYFIVRKITRNKLGMGDVWFGVFQGLCLVPKMLPVCLGVETVLAFVVMGRRMKKGEKLPFIPFMSFALFISFIICL